MATGVDTLQKQIASQLEAKFWDFPKTPDEMRIISYDANDNPLIIEYYKSGRRLFTHYLTYDGSGRIIIKTIKLE